MKKVISNATFADKLLFIFLIAASVSGIFISREAVSQSSDVKIEMDGKLLYNLPVDVNKTISVKGRYENTVIEIKDARVRIKEAHCPNQICVKQGWMSRGVIVCVPNRLVVTIGGSRPARNKVDAVTG